MGAISTLQTNQLKGPFTMRQAQVEDTEEVLSMLVETAEWFQRNGSTQWQDLLKGIDSHRTAEAIEGGDVFVCKAEGDLAGMIILLEKPSEWDRKLWGLEENEQSDAIYLHRLVVRRKYAKHQLGQAILNWCKQSIHFDGKSKIRLDCLADNAFLRGYYPSLGYSFVGEKGGYALYELQLD